jgi:hypothetical protein
MEGHKAYVTYEQDKIEFDAYETKSRDEPVPLSVKAKSGGSTYSNFDTNEDLMYKYNPDEPKDVPSIVMSKAGRIFGGDFKFQFSASDDEDSYVNSNLMSKIKAYKTQVVSIGNGDEDDDDDDDDDDDKTTPIEGKVVHNFSKDGLTSQFFSIIGNLSTGRDSITYNGITLSAYLKLESTTSISFTLAENAKLTVVTDTSTSNFKLDGKKVNTDPTGVTTFELTPGEHSITKADIGYIYMLIIA